MAADRAGAEHVNGPPLPVPVARDAPAGLYVHVPFCSHICPYCDFNTYAGQEGLIPRYVDALATEIRMMADVSGSTGPAPTLFFGGGTPSLLSPEQVRRIIDQSRHSFGLRDDAEITVEANPENLDPAYLTELLAAGVNRLSVGVQSQQRAGLRVLGRGHRSVQAGKAFGAARAAGFRNISLDFIFSWPGQTAAEWADDLHTILEWQPEHVSLYSLILEPGTPLHSAVKRGILTALDDDSAADQYEQAVATLEQAGWEHYEVANWAREPQYRSRHNQLYWQNGPYHGFGAGAHGTIRSVRHSNILLPAKYIEALEAGRRPVAISETLPPEIELGETMMLGLRLLVEGVSVRDVIARHGVDPRVRFDAEITRFLDIGMVEWHGDGHERLRLTSRGAMLANDVCAAFLPSPAESLSDRASN
jgi:oxygen-independent coproporphyrinogen III oxidase